MSQATSSATTANGSATAPKHTASEIGWQFINQYYKFLHGSVEKLHRFYTKKSTFSHGTEGEEVVPCYGQQDIHNKIMSLGFKDPKAFVHHIHSQSSQSGGIIVQVIGEMQNGADDAPWRKFTQTFFLAEQPNGYFVLNDIFMYLKEEGEFEEELVEEEAQAPAAQEEAQPTKADDSADKSPVPPVQAATDMIETSNPTEAASDAQKNEPEAAPAEPVKEETLKPVEETKVEEATKPEEKAAEPETQKEEEHAPEPTAAATATATEPEPTPAAPVQPPKPVEAAPPKPTGPPPPKTWASTAAAAKGAWGTALATKEAAASNPASASAPAASAQAAKRPAASTHNSSQNQSGQAQNAAQGNTAAAAAQGTGHASGNKPSLIEAARATTTNICFVKLNNWQQQDTTPPISEVALETALGKYGEIIKTDFVKTKACAFVEYKSVESARKAIIASLRVQDGGEGGIKIPTENGGFQKIIVESRKEKEDRGKSQGGQNQQGGGQRRQQGDRGQQRQGGQRTGRGGKGGQTGGHGQNRQ